MKALLAAYPGAAKKKVRLRPTAPAQPLELAGSYRLRAYTLSPVRFRAAQSSTMLPLHLAAGGKASEAVVAALLAAHPGAAKEKDEVRPQRPHATLAPPACTTALASPLASLACIRALACSPSHAAQDGRLPLHHAARLNASEAVVAALLAAHPGAAKEKERVHPPCPQDSLHGRAPLACIWSHSLAHRRAVQDGLQPLHHAAGQRASEAVVAALLEAHPGAAKEKDRVRPPCLHIALSIGPHRLPACLLSLALCRAALSVGGYRCIMLRERRRQRRWCRNCWRLTPALLRRRPRCASPLSWFAPRSHSLSAALAAQLGRLPLHFAAAGKASEMVVKLLLEDPAHPGAAKGANEKDGVRPPDRARVRPCVSRAVTARLHLRRMGTSRCTMLK